MVTRSGACWSLSEAGTKGVSASSAVSPRVRLVSIDWLRGFVMVLMAFDHASLFFNADRVALDSAAEYSPGDALPTLQFFARWVTHLCAPTFLFLSGTALALSSARRGLAGRDDWQFDRDMLIRGALIASLEVFGLGSLAPIRLVSVLFAIGVSMMLMVPLRRLSDVTLLGAALLWMVGGEWVTALFWQGEGDASILASLTVARHYSTQVHILYPVLHWLPLMMLGWVFGNHLESRQRAGSGAPIALLLGCSAAGLLVFLVVRGLGGYGNMFLYAENWSMVQLLHVSKYPPSLAFHSLELSLMAACLAASMGIEMRLEPRRNGLLLVLGQTALAFYLLHFILLGLSRSVLGLERGGIEMALVAAAAVIAFLYPFCRWFRSYKQAHPGSWVRFI
jgi:uncharacterized membrane protein